MKAVKQNSAVESTPAFDTDHTIKTVDPELWRAIEREKNLFGAEYANVQPHSGSQANQAVYLAVLKPGDVILGMSLAHGGHLTHGAPVNVSGKLFRAMGYGLHPDTEEIDYDCIQRVADEHKPKMIVAGASAYSRVIDWRRFREIAD